MNIERAKNILLGIVLMALLTPIIFSFSMSYPFQSPKIVFFLFFIELGIPVYTFLLSGIQNKKALLLSPMNIALSVFMGIISIASIFGEDPINSLLGNSARMEGLIVYLHFFLFYLYLQLTLTLKPQYKKLILHFFLAVMAISAGVAWLQYFQAVPNFVLRLFGTRATGLSGNPIFFSGMMTIPVFLSAGLLHTGKSKIRHVFLGLSVFFFCAILFTQTRGALLGILCGIFAALSIFAIKHPSKKIRTRFITLAAALPILFVIFFVVARPLVPVTSSFYRYTQFQDDSARIRLIYWKNAIESLQDHPLLGVGLQNYYIVAQKYFPAHEYKNSGNEWPDKAHNQFLEYLATAGIAGFMSYLWIYFSALHTLTRKQYNQDEIHPAFYTGALIAFAVQNIFGFETIDTLLPLLFLFAFAGTDIQNKPEVETERGRLIMMGLIICPILSSIFFLLPVYQLFHTTHSIKQYLAQSPDKTLREQKKLENLSFAYDAGHVANTELSIILSPSISDASKESIRTHAYTSFETSLQRHPKRAQFRDTQSIFTIEDSSKNNTPVSSESISNAITASELADKRQKTKTLLASLYQQAGEHEMALKTFEEALRMDPQNGVILWDFAYYYYKQNDMSKFANYTLKSIEAKYLPPRSNQLDAIFEYFLRTQDTENALFIAQHAAKIEPTNPTYKLQLMKALLRDNKNEQAIELGKKIAAEHPDHLNDVQEMIQLYYQTSETSH